MRGGGDLRGDEGAGAGNHALTLLDWGDCGIGNPLLDQPAFLDRVPPSARATVREHWVAEWRRHRPGSDPAEAGRLVAPVAAARQALIYQHFLDHIEPAERRYHEADVPEWLARTAALVSGTIPTALTTPRLACRAPAAGARHANRGSDPHVAEPVTTPARLGTCHASIPTPSSPISTPSSARPSRRRAAPW